VPITRRWINERFAAVPADEARRMLGENAVEFYGLHRDALTPIAARIGPTPDEVHVPSPEPLPA
jgi:hypothetical protein